MSQYINLPSLYANGLNVSWTSNTTLTIAAGQCRDSTNSFDITLSADTVLNAANTGINGLDKGSLANSTMYHVFVVYDSSLLNPVGVLLSTSPTNPYMPFNYSQFRRVGTVKTDGSAHFLNFYRKSTNSNVVLHQWDTPISILAGGTATTFTALSLAGAVPAQAERVYLNADYTPTAAASTANIRPTGSAAAAGSCPIILKENLAAVAVNSQWEILPQISAGNLSIDYIVSSGDALTLTVPAFEDIL